MAIVTAAGGGQEGVCHLPDGTAADEWEYFRASQTPATERQGEQAAGFGKPRSSKAHPARRRRWANARRRGLLRVCQGSMWPG